MTKVLVFERKGGASGYITDGWLNAFRDSGIVAERWNGKEDSWFRFGPDLYLGCSGHRQPVPDKKRRGCKVAIHVNPRGSKSIPGIDESKEAIAWVEDVVPDAVYGYGHEKDRPFWNGWDRAGMPWVPMGTAGDLTKFDPSNGSHGAYQIVYLGGRWSYKATNIDKYLLPLLQSKRLTYRVHGWGDWPKGLCSGELPEASAPVFLASGLAGPCISEPHTTTFGIDLPERVFKVALSGTIVIHDCVSGFAELLPNIKMARTPAEFTQMAVDVSRMCPADLDKLKKEQLGDVLHSHTYHHRLIGLFDQLGFDATGLQQSLTKRIADLGF